MKSHFIITVTNCSTQIFIKVGEEEEDDDE
jgi:hypothetical protein